jgi:uncharacterized protein with FMN-binding domain
MTLSGIGILAATAACSTGGSSTSPGGSSPETPVAPVAYTDGTYSATGAYESPGGTETVEVQLTLAKNIITAVTVTPQARDASGQIYQGMFAQGISAVVVGKDINTLHVAKVSGSSLTSGGFTDALAKIKAEAGG